MDSKKRAEELRKLIEYHSDRYYNQDDPEISDYEFDQLTSCLLYTSVNGKAYSKLWNIE